MFSGDLAGPHAGRVRRAAARASTRTTWAPRRTRSSAPGPTGRHPLFVGLIGAALARQREERLVEVDAGRRQRMTDTGEPAGEPLADLFAAPAGDPLRAGAPRAGLGRRPGHRRPRPGRCGAPGVPPPPRRRRRARPGRAATGCCCCGSTATRCGWSCGSCRPACSTCDGEDAAGRGPAGARRGGRPVRAGAGTCCWTGSTPRAGWTRRCGSTWPATCPSCRTSTATRASTRSSTWSPGGCRWTRRGTRSWAGGCTTRRRWWVCWPPAPPATRGWATLRPADAPWPEHPSARPTGRAG